MTASGWLLWALGDGPRRERALADAAVSADRARAGHDLAADDRRFRSRMDQLARERNVLVGATVEGSRYLVSIDDLISLPTWATAATGAGKSRLVGSLMRQVIAAIVRGEPVSLIDLDGKGEGADQTLRTVAATVAGIPERDRPALFDRLHTLRFFDSPYVASCPLFAPVPGVSVEAHADAVAEALTEVVADAAAGPRQRATLAGICALAVELGVPLPALPWLLSSPRDVASLAARSSSPLVRLELSRFERESQSSIDGLLARLGVILRVPDLKAALAGETPFDFGRCFEPGSITTISFGGAPLGARAGVRVAGSLILSALANAAFDPRRTVRGKTWLVLDEPQVILTSVALGQIERLVTLGRSFGAGGLALVHQGAIQLPVELQTILNTNVVMRILGRSSERDAAAASEWLPRTGRVPRPRPPGATSREPAFLSPGEEERFHVLEMGRLPARHFLVSDRRAQFAPRVVRAPEYDPPAWDALPRDVADAVLRGSAGVPRAALEARVRGIEETAAARFAEQVRAEEPGRGRRSGPSTPSVVGTRPRRAGGGIP